jgi:predicted small lipoprotein YifL
MHTLYTQMHQPSNTIMSNIPYRPAILGAFALVLSVNGCGQKGPLYLPPDKAAEKKQERIKHGQLPDAEPPAPSDPAQPAK